MPQSPLFQSRAKVEASGGEVPRARAREHLDVSLSVSGRAALRNPIGASLGLV